MDGDHAADGSDVADGKVDLSKQQGKNLGHGQDHDDRALLKQVHQVARGQKQVVWADGLEDEGDDDKPENDRQNAAIATPDPHHPATEPLAQ